MRKIRLPYTLEILMEDWLPGYDSWKTTEPEEDDPDDVYAREDAELDRAGL